MITQGGSSGVYLILGGLLVLAAVFILVYFRYGMPGFQTGPDSLYAQPSPVQDNTLPGRTSPSP